jgi:hypothetical protein
MRGERKTCNSAAGLVSISDITKKLGWRFYAGIVLYSLVVLLVTMRFCPSFYWSSSAAVGVIALTMVRFWAFSRRLWFWATLVLMAVLQIPLVLATNEWANRYKGSFIFLFMLFDFVVIDLVIRWVSPELKKSRQTSLD